MPPRTSSGPLARRLLRILGALLAALWAAPATAFAHGLPSAPGVPVPGFLFAWGAAVVLVASFAGLSALWREPRLERARPRPLVRLPRALDPLCGALGVAAFAGLIACGLAGAQSPVTNLLPTAVYVLFWVGLVVVSALFGDVFAAFNPWRAAARGIRWGAARAGLRTPPPLTYPAWLGRWPAVAGIAGFAWLELAYGNRGAPATLALLGLGYAGVQLVGMALYGIEAWSARGDAFGVYFGLFGRISPLVRTERALGRRPWLAGLAALEPVPGTIALLCVMIGSTSFDGLSATTPWRQLAPHLERGFASLGAGPVAASELAATVGLLMMVALIALVYALGVRGMRSLRPGIGAAELGRLFAHALVPIAAGYVVAHYFTFLVDQGQAVAALISDPLGHGANLFGTAHATIDYKAVPRDAVWYVQVAALLAGHVAGLVLAHDRAVALFRDRDLATRSQYWMLTVMVGYTGLGLWLLSSIAR